MAQSYDRILRENIVPIVEVFAYQVLGIQPVSSQRQDPNLPKTLEKKPDFVSKLVLPNQPHPVILHLEIQTETDSVMHLRMLEYYALLRRKYQLQVLQYVILLRGDGKKMPSHIKEGNIDFNFTVVPIKSISAESMLDTGTPELTVMAILGGFEKREAAAVIRRILE